MCDQPGTLRNHRAWLLGNIAKSRDFGGMQFGLASMFSAAWGDLFKRGLQPVSDRKLYPAKADLMAELKPQHNKLMALAKEVDQEVMSRPLEDAFRRKLFPTLGDFLSFVMVVHEAMHPG